ncbi:MAG: diguanylate cyclase [Sphingomonadaceae bacterium]
MLLFAGAAPARAQAEFAPGSTCHATAQTPASAASARWNCEQRDWSIDEPYALMRFDLRGTDNRQPEVLTSRLVKFIAMQVTVIGSDGRKSSATYRSQDAKFGTSDWVMQFDLPAYDGPADAILVEIDRPARPLLLSSLAVAKTPTDTPQSLRMELMIAMMCGVLLVPLVFNFAFFRVLRERFLLWHVVAVLFMLTQTFVTSGLVNRFFDFSLETLVLLAVTTFNGAIISAAMVAANIIEPGKLDAWHRNLLRSIGLLILPVQLVYLDMGDLRPFASDIYYISFIPVVLLYVSTLWIAARRGSRVVWFQIVAWTPLLAVGSTRIVSALGATDALLTLQLHQHIAITLEVVITSLGVADRFMVLKRQRDRAYEESRTFETLAERDPLTGLMNRRLIENRFEALRAEGFTSLAAVDLDHFKDINDTYGHGVGDDVLRAVAKALQPDAETLVVRLGGEEFLVLLKGDDPLRRAEQRRQAITTRVAHDVPELSSPVTASMGLVEIPGDAIPDADFALIYERADRLLYEAKEAGRNRTVSERMKVFKPRKADRRRVAA